MQLNLAESLIIFSHGQTFSEFYHKVFRGNSSFSRKFSKTSFREFLDDTYSEFQFVSCAFMNEDCKDEWHDVTNLYGNCKGYTPRLTQSLISPFGRQATLSLVIVYNESDWTAGWNHFMKGATVFFKPHYEVTEDPDESIVLNPGGLPLIRFRKRIHSLLGPPFSECTNM